MLDARPALWGLGERWRSYEAFVHAAGLVQSRSFHVNADNWLTGETTEGAAPGPPTSMRQGLLAALVHEVHAAARRTTSSAHMYYFSGRALPCTQQACGCGVACSSSQKCCVNCILSSTILNRDAHLVGEELYMLPALDMLNHTRVAERRNSSLQQSHEAMTVRRGDADVAFTGHFSMAAGEAHTCCMVEHLEWRSACACLCIASC